MPKMRDMHREDHRRMFTAKSKQGHECSCHYTARIQGGFLFFSGMPKKSEPPPHQISQTDTIVVTISTATVC